MSSTGQPADLQLIVDRVRTESEKYGLDQGTLRERNEEIERLTYNSTTLKKSRDE